MSGHGLPPFVTVVTGLLATIVGALGMNFRASFFETDDAGFFGVVGSSGSRTAARHRRRGHAA